METRHHMIKHAARNQNLTSYLGTTSTHAQPLSTDRITK
jgi:hypothetical protein